MSHRTTVRGILDFWFGSSWESGRPVPGARLKLWFGGEKETDRLISERFGTCLERARSGDCEAWLASARGRLALILVLDQFTRNIHRGSPAAFAEDDRALDICLNGLERGDDLLLPPLGRAFFYLPLEHAENLAIQDRSVAAFRELCRLAPATQRQTFASFFDYALRHREVIVRFGRYPHRNAILGRKSSAAEREFLKQPGSSF